MVRRGKLVFEGTGKKKAKKGARGSRFGVQNQEREASVSIVTGGLTREGGLRLKEMVLSLENRRVFE